VSDLACETSAGDVIERFAGRSASAARALAQWRADRRKAAVVPIVEAHVSRVVYELGPGDVEAVGARTEHALANASKATGEGLAAIRDWHPAFAFTHMFHFVTEAMAAIPTFQEFREFCSSEGLGRAMLGDPAREVVAAAVRGGAPRKDATDAMRWRVGNAYYAFLKEMYVLAHIRAAGFDMRTHPLADALFRVDGWVGETNLSLFIGNQLYRSEQAGRKWRPERLLDDARPAFRYLPIELPTERRFGMVHLPTAEAFGAAVAELRDPLHL
jgi:hypothetical protein